MERVAAEEPGQIVPSEILLGLSLLLGEGPKALEAWRSYYRISEQFPARGLLTEPAEVLERLLPQWSGEASSPEEREQLALALAGSRFFDFAALLADASPVRGPRIRDILAYQQYLGAVAETTLAFYRVSVIREQNQSEYRRRLRNLLSNIGAETSHGRANERIMGGIVKWMNEHRSDVGGFDPERPTLPQLDLLTPDQLREVFRSMDSSPLYQ